MPISYRLDGDLNAIFTSVSGVVTDRDMVAHAGRVTTDPDIPAGARALVDFGGVEKVDVTAEGIRRVAEIFRMNSYAPKTAFVANSDVAYGMSRMFEFHRDDSPAEIRTFRDYGEAKQWLGLP